MPGWSVDDSVSKNVTRSLQLRRCFVHFFACPKKRTKERTPSTRNFSCAKPFKKCRGKFHLPGSRHFSHYSGAEGCIVTLSRLWFFHCFNHVFITISLFTISLIIQHSPLITNQTLTFELCPLSLPACRLFSLRPGLKSYFHLFSCRSRESGNLLSLYELGKKMVFIYVNLIILSCGKELVNNVLSVKHTPSPSREVNHKISLFTTSLFTQNSNPTCSRQNTFQQRIHVEK